MRPENSPEVSWVLTDPNNVFIFGAPSEVLFYSVLRDTVKPIVMSYGQWQHLEAVVSPFWAFNKTQEVTKKAKIRSGHVATMYYYCRAGKNGQEVWRDKENLKKEANKGAGMKTRKQKKLADTDTTATVTSNKIKYDVVPSGSCLARSRWLIAFVDPSLLRLPTV